MRDDLGFWFATTLAAFGIGLGAGVTTAQQNVHALMKDAINHGYAQYCPDTGAWAWKGECK